VQYAQQHPEQVAQLVLMETFPFRLQSSDFAGPYRVVLNLLQVKVLRSFLMGRLNLLLQAFPYFFEHARSAETLQCYRAPFEEGSSAAIPVLFEELPLWGSNAARFSTLEDFLRQTTIPCHWLTGTPGLLNRPPRLRWLQEQVNTLKLHRIGRSGHFIPEEQPRSVADVVQRVV
jgi:pimeloyl-ACP methyl ester carboxylesterase